MPKCDFDKIVQLEIEIEIKIEIAFRHECSPVNLLHIFRTPFPKNTSGELLMLVNDETVWELLQRTILKSFSIFKNLRTVPKKGAFIIF